MKISKNWLKEQIDFNLTTEELVDLLTMIGLEVDSVESIAPDFSGVVVGKVLETTQHPNADKLTLCKVDVGGSESLEIICGASNVRPNLKVPVAVVGAILPGDFKIKKAKLRGVESCGMICAAREIGLPDEVDGIMELPEDAPLGQNIREHLDLDDDVIDIELTANRGDCLSIHGIAREVFAACKDAKLKPTELKDIDSSNDTFSVTITAKERCPRYCGRIIRGINNSVSTPIWMKERLLRLGETPINFVVDVANYVMYELGNPLHAFDLSKLDDQIEVRLAKPNEKLKLLDDSEVELNDDTLIIADSKKPLAIAGIMGGSDSGTYEDTKDIFLESAFFNPEKILVTGRKYNLSTDSSYRFERGVDYELQRKALDRVTSLILEIAGGIPEDVVEVVSEKHLPKKPDVILRRESVENILGISIEDERISSILNRLGMKAEIVSEGWKVVVPSFRFDIEIEVDLVEELARIYGYHLIPEEKFLVELDYNSTISEKNTKDRLYSLMEDKGYHEVITYSFVDEKSEELLGGGAKSLLLANPISQEHSVMRTTLWPGLIDVVKYNLKRQQKRSRFFEIGMRFLPKDDGSLEQNYSIAGVICGDLCSEQWGLDQNANQVDFFDLKNDVDAILKLFTSGNFSYVPEDSLSALHPKRSAKIFLDGKPIGFIGEIHPIVKEELDLDKKIYLFELDLDFLQNKPKIALKQLSKYPQVTRDIAIIVDKKVIWSEIKQKIVDISGDLLHNTTIFDVYCNENMGLSKRSMAIRLVFQSIDRTLVDAEIEQLVDRVVLVLGQTFNASLRG